MASQSSPSPHDQGQPMTTKAPGIKRVWVDGCFDMHHYGHANLLRQAAAFGQELYVGIHTDEEIVKAKGFPPMMTSEERYAAVRACKWVTAVVEAVPYCTDPADIEKYQIDYIVHGDDVAVTVDGTNAYHAVQDKLKLVRRTFGISTTDIMNRMMKLTLEIDEHSNKQAENLRPDFGVPMPMKSPKGMGDSHFLTTSRKIQQFSVGNRAPTAEDKIVYVDGDFDLFHVGHIAFLKEAKKQGTYLIVGVHTDEAVNHKKGMNFPIMSLNERVLCVLQCRYVDEAIIGVPYEVTAGLMEELNVNVVCAGLPSSRLADEEPYDAPKKAGKFKEIDSGSTLLTRQIIERVLEKRELLEERSKQKAVKDKESQSGPRVQEIDTSVPLPN